MFLKRLIIILYCFSVWQYSQFDAHCSARLNYDALTNTRIHYFNTISWKHVTTTATMTLGRCSYTWRFAYLPDTFRLRPSTRASIVNPYYIMTYYPYKYNIICSYFLKHNVRRYRYIPSLCILSMEYHTHARGYQFKLWIITTFRFQFLYVFTLSRCFWNFRKDYFLIIIHRIFKFIFLYFPLV